MSRRVCPKCAGVDTIRFWEKKMKQCTLDGEKHPVYDRCRPTCTNCGEVFPIKYKFEEVY